MGLTGSLIHPKTRIVWQREPLFSGQPMLVGCPERLPLDRNYGDSNALE